MTNAYELYRQRKIAKMAQGDSILDIGCAHLPNRYLRGCSVVGLDINDMEISPPYTEHIVGDAINIGELLGERRFETVILGEVIEHGEKPYELLREIRPCISEGGTLIMSTPNPLGLPVVLIEYMGLRKFFYTSKHLYYFTPRWARRLLEQAGYKITKTTGCGAWVGGLPVPAPVTLSYIVIYCATPA